MKAILIFLNCFFFSTQAFAVSEAAVLFLLIQPSPRATGMGDASVSSFDHSPMNANFNPAHVAYTGLKGKLNTEFYLHNRDIFPGFNLEDRYFESHAYTYGNNFQMADGTNINVGAGYSRVFANYGKQIITGEAGPDPIGTFNSNDGAHIFSIGVGLDFGIRTAIGMSYKFIESNLAPFRFGTELVSAKAEANAWDIGLYMELPIIKSNKQLEAGIIAPFLNSSLGIARANIGGRITYIDENQADPLPRVSRIGLGLQGGLRQRIGGREFDVLAVEYLSEAEDLLVRRKSSGPPDYNVDISYDIYGHTNPITNVLLGIGDKEVITKRGLALEFAELLSLSIGRYEDDDGNVHLNTGGIGIKLQGLFNIMALLGNDISNDSMLVFIRDNINLEYFHSKYGIFDDKVGTRTSYNGIRIRLFN